MGRQEKVNDYPAPRGGEGRGGSAACVTSGSPDVGYRPVWIMETASELRIRNVSTS